jgi:hypothetical protein
VVRPGRRVSVLDKFLGDEEEPSLVRRGANLLASVLFSDINRRLGPLVAVTSLVLEHEEPFAFGGLYRSVVLRRPE